MKKLLILLFFTFLCANEKIDYNNPIFKDKAFQKLLKEQLKRGAEVLEGEGSIYPACGFNAQILEQEEDIIAYVLKVYGYKTPQKTTFLKILKNSFAVTAQAKISPFIENTDHNWYSNYITEGYDLVIFRDKRFVMLPLALPELIEVNKVSTFFKKLNQNVKKDGVLMWKEYVDSKKRQQNIEFIINLNRTIFHNDTRALKKMLNSKYYGFYKSLNVEILDIFFTLALNEESALKTLIDKAVHYDDEESLAQWLKNKKVVKIFEEKIEASKSKVYNYYSRVLMNSKTKSKDLERLKEKYGLKKLVEINNYHSKSLYDFCSKNGYSVIKIKKLNSWINKDATNIGKYALIVVDDSALDTKNTNPQCLHPLNKKELDKFRDEKYREAEAYIVKHRADDNGQTFRSNIIIGLIKTEGEFSKIKGTSCFQYKIFESVKAPLSEFEGSSWITIEKRDGKFVLIEVEISG